MHLTRRKGRAFLRLLFGLAFLMALASCSLTTRESGRDQALAIAVPPQIDPRLLAKVLPRDTIPAIQAPRFETTAQAAGMADGERVIALEINGDARAYPINILSSHEIVNDVVGGEPVAVTWCPLCYSALVFSRRAAGRTLSFGVSGQLLNNTLVMYDHQTESLWSQLYGGAIAGPLNGTALGVFPSVLAEWRGWAAANPRGQVLSKRQTCAAFSCGEYASNPRGSYVVDPYAGYYRMPDEGVVNRQIPRETSREPKRRVLGVRLGDAARAYPLAILARQRVINDEIDGVPVVIWFDPQTETGAVFERRLTDAPLVFAPHGQDSTLMLDERGDRWLGISGEAQTGPFAGRRLAPLVSTPAFEFGWYGYFPASDTYGAP